MTNQAVNNSLFDASAMHLRESLAILVRNHGPDDIVRILSDVMDDYAMKYARRTGDYDGASSMKLVAAYLDGLETFVDNYDPTTE